MSAGHAWIVGAGPGDPGLITVAAVRAIEQADAVLYDALVNPALLRYARPGAELVFVGKRSGKHAMSQSEIEALLVKLTLEGKRVARLKGGDPFVFGRGGEEALACRRAGIGYTIVPGITSAIAGPAYAGIPVTHRGVASNFMVITGSDPGDAPAKVDWVAATRADTLIILMGVNALPDCMSRLMAEGAPANRPVVCVRWGTRPDQELLKGTVGTIAGLARERNLESPVVTVVGDVASLSEQLAWFEPGPLAGKRVVVTRARAQSSELASQLEALGAFVVEAPVIGIRHRHDDLVADERVTSRWDWIVFTSANGVEAFFAALRATGRDCRSLGATKVAAIGEATRAALSGQGIVADFSPSRATSECLAAEIPRIAGARLLLPVSALTDDRLADALRRRGGLVEQVTAYENVLEPLDDERKRAIAEAHAITFTSASTARNLLEALDGQPLSQETKLVSIGPQTSAAVREAFGRVDVEAAGPALESLAAATTEALTWGS